MPIVRTIALALGPVTAAIINNMMMPGMDNQKSARRMINMSILPPKKPEISPRITPMVP